MKDPGELDAGGERLQPGRGQVVVTAASDRPVAGTADAVPSPSSTCRADTAGTCLSGG